MWISTDIAEPSYDNQIVKAKVADFAGNYTTDAYYNHREQKWYSKDGVCLIDNVFQWQIPLFKICKFLRK